MIFLHGQSSLKQDGKKFLYGGRCLREQVKDDVVKIYEMVEGPVQVKLINTLGSFI
jgi:hypothetical protein